MRIILAVGVPSDAISEEMRGGLPIEEIQLRQLPHRLIRDMDAAVIFPPELEAEVMLCLMFAKPDLGDGPTPIMMKNGELWK